MIKMNKLALCALLSVGVVPVVNGDDKVRDLVGKDSVQLFNCLQTSERCDKAFKNTGKLLAKAKKRETRNALIRLIEKLNFLCDFWSWLRDVKPGELDVEKIFSEGVSGDEDLRNAEELIFLRDAGWGCEIKEGDEDYKSKFDELRGKCKDFI